MRNTSLLLLLVLLLTACGQSEDVLEPVQPAPEGKESPVSFASAMSDVEEVTTRGAESLEKDFKVWGFKQTGAGEQVVFNNYTVRYKPNSAYTSEDNTHNYTYIEDEGQEMKYWDQSSADYHFWGYTSASSANYTYNENEKLLTIPWTLRAGDPIPGDYIYFSKLVERRPVHPDVVRLEFMRPFAKVCIQFYTILPLSVEDVIDITNIRFTPMQGVAPQVSKIYKEGKVYVKYPSVRDCSGSAKEEIYIKREDLKEPEDQLEFMDVQLSGAKKLGVSSNTAVTAPIDNGGNEDFDFDLGDMPGVPLNAPTRAGEEPGRKYYYYPLPMGEYNPAFQLSLYIDADDEPVTAQVPAQYMQWKANHSYTYIFKILEGGVIFVDAIVEDWKPGGGVTDKWTNW